MALSRFLQNALSHHMKKNGGKRHRFDVKKQLETPEPNATSDTPVQPGGQFDAALSDDVTPSVPGPISATVPSHHFSAFSAMAGKKRKRAY